MPVLLWLLIALAFVVSAIAFLWRVFLSEAGRRRVFPALRPLYKRVFNPRVVRAAARHETSWGVVHHVGRRSGASYDTPIDAQRTPDGVLIPLVYGPSSDWCRNILAAGHCTLTLDGAELTLTSPQVIPASDAEPRVPAAAARRWHSLGIEHCLSLKTAPIVAAQSS
jgi:deazaflavin-dependent oxidoreductase (nitroreductase family)